MSEKIGPKEAQLRELRQLKNVVRQRGHDAAVKIIEKAERVALRKKPKKAKRK